MSYVEAGRFTVVLHRDTETKEVFVETQGEATVVWCKAQIRDAMLDFKRALNPAKKI